MPLWVVFAGFVVLWVLSFIVMAEVGTVYARAFVLGVAVVVWVVIELTRARNPQRREPGRLVAVGILAAIFMVVNAAILAPLLLRAP